MTYSTLRRVFAVAGLFWMVLGIALHNMGLETASLTCSYLMWVCVVGVFWSWVGRL